MRQREQKWLLSNMTVLNVVLDKGLGFVKEGGDATPINRQGW
jgi:hypothetical protein